MRVRDENEPKKPQSAFFIFSAIRRKEIKEGGQQVKVTDFAKQIGQEWKAMEEEQKAVYLKKERKAKKHYRK